ncbi:hypothetical protein [Natrinema soli]|uniref:Uncharacterized protein n=1 Tax=Natrinema soli TaxID=1930624 RepID=A0ABD5SIX1_9EURY|nr:hypothetical protein [Natrinema soli]
MDDRVTLGVRRPEQHTTEWVVGITVSLWREECLEKGVGSVEERLDLLESASVSIVQVGTFFRFCVIG